MSHKRAGKEDGGVILKERPVNDFKVAPPKMKRVYVMNDNHSTMDFVIEIFMGVFGKSYEQSYRLMLNVHELGKGLGGTYTEDIAAAKVQKVRNLADSAGFPLCCTTEDV